MFVIEGNSKFQLEVSEKKDGMKKSCWGDHIALPVPFRAEESEKSKSQAPNSRQDAWCVGKLWTEEALEDSSHFVYVWEGVK